MKKEDILNALEIVDNEKQEIITPTKSTDDHVEKDFDYVRNNLYSTIEQGSLALEEIVNVAQQSQHPRAYEVVSTLINSLTNANKDLLNISKLKKELVKKEEETTQVNNTLNFVGSTSEFQQLIKGKLGSSYE